MKGEQIGDTLDCTCGGTYEIVDTHCDGPVTVDDYQCNNCEQWLEIVWETEEEEDCVDYRQESNYYDW